MATFTKTQFEKRIEDLKEKISGLKEELGEVQDALEELQGDLESESSDIEPYEGKSDLTPAQEERQEWLDNAAATIEETLI